MADLFPDIAVGEVLVEGLTLPFVAEAAITKGQVVKVTVAAASGTLARVNVAGAGEIGIGVALKSVTAGEEVPVCVAGVVKVGAIAGAIAVGSRVKTAAGGKITVAADTDIVGILGIALQTFAAATADDGLIYLCPI